MSWSQQRLWFLAQLDAAAGQAYHLPAALRLQGALNGPALRATLDRLVARHEVLRTTIVSQDGQPVQVIGEVETGFALDEQDLSGLHGHEQESAVERLVLDEALAPFDLAQGPLIRGRLLKLSAQEHILLVTQHHIVSDGWSMGVLVREVSALYDAFSQGKTDPLPALPLQYADYAAWQRGWLQGEALQAQLAYWRGHLAGAPALLALPADRARPAQQSYRGESVACRLPAELTAGLKALSQQHGVTLFMTLLAGWSVLLGRLSGQDDVVVGTPVANRQRRELEGLIGFFVNTLALRVRLEDDPSVESLLQQVKESALAAYGHQDVPFEQVVEALRPVRSMSHSPVFQAMLSLNNTPAMPALALPGLTLSNVTQEQLMAHFDLTLALEESGDELLGTISYASDLFDRSTVARWAGHLETLLRAMVQAPSQAVSRLALLNAAERRQVVAGFNETAAAYPQDKLIHELFAGQAQAQPEATALVYAGQELSYGELNRRANQLAHRLRALGVGPDVLVGICMERSLEMVVGLLGILKAGGAYVPLDPSYPQERLELMLDDSAPVVVLTQQALRDRLPPSLPLLCLDGAAEAAQLALQPESDPERAGQRPDHLAYVIYTSGSTGRPKGVMLEHRNALRLVINSGFAPLTAEDCVVHCANSSFDAAIWEIWGALLNGARMLVVVSDDLLDPVAFHQVLERGKATALLLTPRLFNAYAEPLRPVFNRLRWLLVGGEALDPVIISNMLKQGMPPAHLMNAYGPTEAATVASTYPIVDAIVRTSVPLGRPISNTQIYILDRHLQPVPLGVAGEIHIGGIGVARGYLKRPELTAERFITDPFSAEPGARLYKTGDLGRWLADGNIEYLGRNDFQVKLRGFRIELGEIETRLGECAGVREAVVIAREDQPGDQRLVAYLTAQEGAVLEPGVLRAALAAQLPEYMVPSAFVMLEAFPLTPNGKLDRKALPAPDQGEIVSRTYAAPQGEVEQVLADIWQELLGIGEVGRDDHFFELGGHSLLAVQLVSRVRQTLDAELPLRALFAQPTLAALATAVAQAQQAALPAIDRADRSGALPLSWSQQRLWFLAQLDAAAGQAYHLPAALRLQGALNGPALRATLDRLVARHEVLRTTIVSQDGQPVQVIGEAETGFALDEQDLSGLHGHEQEAAVNRFCMDEALAPFDLAQGPLIRGRLLKLSAQEHILLVTQHHIVSDGWSMGVLVREVSALYEAFSQGKTDPLPALPLQYADYAAWQRGWLQGEALQAQLAYWRGHLAGAPALLALPADRARPAQQSYRGESVACRLPAELTAGLKALSQQHGVTLFMTLLAGWSVLLGRLSGQDDVVVGTPVANRQRRELEGLIGFFVNTLALRVRLEDDPSVESLLQQVKESALAAYGHQDVPFEQVVEALRPVRSMSHSPVFQAMLSLNNTPAMPALALPGLTLSNVTQEQLMAHFDLTLALEESGDELLGTISYASDLFDRSTVARWAGHLETLLRAMVQAPSQAVSRLALLNAAERRQVVAGFNETAAAYPQDKLIHELFAGQAQAQPEATALVYAGQELSYGELNRRANQLAHRLRALGVGPDVLVGICMERSLEMVVGLLGILKAGGAYVPLDPSYPQERLELMLDDSAPVVVLTQQALRDRLPPSLPLLCLDGAAEAAQLALQPESDPERAGQRPDHLAYVIYTSGSTGRPKGVMITHRSVVNLWMALRKTLLADVQCSTRLALNASIAFDASVKGIIQLLSGATLLLIPQAIRQDGRAMRSFIAQHEIDVFDCTPSQLALMSDTDQQIALSRNCKVLVGGEAITQKLWTQFRESREFTVFNVYGPTECTVDSSWAELSDAAQPSIGKPLLNTQIYVLDQHRMPLPLGVAGEIYIGGAGVARGYLKRPELTAERFITDPFSAEPKARLYKTGDLGRWLADGTIEYVGRNDFQVKVRGFRIELGEIEAALAVCAGVRAAVVIAREDNPGDQRLVAYLTAQEDAVLEPGVLRAALAAQLPEYMVPAAFVTLEAFPLTPNGKLDRKALPAPEQGALVRHAYTAPQGEVEAALAAIWQELLGVERVGRDDHFFELGGHSLVLVELGYRIKVHFQVELGISQLYQVAQLSSMAAQIGELVVRSDDTQQTIVTLEI
ncbi:non-ribosomal peptide synthetase [Massilia sp. BJB1822]|uniref:non-ribosomal peptide synthetase n=2 Tax=Massilia sp. BJB1822 TaxID=2744470 RepID=UPI001E627010|nr:non-ribosomal peptide synthetase [Massilia sp. BJB1822]